MAPNSEVSGLRTALAMGAAKAVLISDDALAGSDSLGTAKVLAKAVERVGDVDLVLTATESTDGYTGTVPEQIAELLDWPSLTFAKHIEIADGKVKIERQTEAGLCVGVPDAMRGIGGIEPGRGFPQQPLGLCGGALDLECATQVDADADRVDVVLAKHPAGHRVRLAIIP